MGFIAGRTTHENILLTQEIIHHMHISKRQLGLMILKLYLVKAYDRIRWDFIDDPMLVAGFRNQFRACIIHCIRSATIHVQWNGIPSEGFRPERGIRQGDPLSPYLFSLCMERLFHRIRAGVASKKWLPFRKRKMG